MSRRAQENLVAVVLLAVLAGFLVISFTYGAKARMVPVPVAAISILLVLAQLILQNTRHGVHLNVDPAELIRGGRGEGTPADAEAPEPSDEAEVAAAAESEADGTRVVKERGGSEWAAFGLVALFIAMIWLIGLMPSVFLFVTGYFLFSRRKWYLALLWGGVTELAIYLLFVEVLKVQMNEGWLLRVLFGG